MDPGLTNLWPKTGSLIGKTHGALKIVPADPLANGNASAIGWSRNGHMLHRGNRARDKPIERPA
jgi:hypothetical protein